jgi:iron complex outermembrane receptor protein
MDRRALVPSLLIFPVAILAAAQEAPETELETVVVIGSTADAAVSGLAGSLDVIDRAEISYEHVDDTLELLSRIPGVYLARYNQGVINTDVSVRGFAGDGATPHAKLLIDGIPSNLNNGYNELDQMFPLGIGAVEVFKGTSDARYGLYNIAGNYSVRSRDDVATEVEATLGSFETRELQGYLGREDGSLRHSYFAGYRRAEGYRDHTDLEKFVVSGRWAFDVSSRSTAGLAARYSGYEGDSPGYLTGDVARAAPRSSASYADQDGGRKRIGVVSAHYDTHFGDGFQWGVAGYGQRFERERWVRFSEAGAIQNRYGEERHIGATSTLRWRPAGPWSFAWGVDAETQEVIEQRFGTVGQTRERDMANVLRNWDFSFDNVGTFLHVEHAPGPMLRWNLGLRADWIDGDFVQFSAAGVPTPRTIYDFGAVIQPKLNVFFQPVDRLTLFANAGRSFQHPFGADAFTTGSTGARDVSINDGWELGGKWSPVVALDLRLSVWRQQAKDEFVVVDDTAQNVGSTDRRGADLAASWQAHERVGLWASYTRIDTEVVTPADSGLANVGNELRGIPRYTTAFGATVKLASAWTARMRVDGRGGAYANEANLGGRFGGYTLLNASVDYETGWGGLSLQLNNITDRYHEYVYDQSVDGTDIIHSPGDGINGSLTVRLRF